MGGRQIMSILQESMLKGGNGGIGLWHHQTSKLLKPETILNFHGNVNQSLQIYDVTMSYNHFLIKNFLQVGGPDHKNV